MLQLVTLKDKRTIESWRLMTQNPRNWCINAASRPANWENELRKSFVVDLFPKTWASQQTSDLWLSWQIIETLLFFYSTTMHWLTVRPCVCWNTCSRRLSDGSYGIIFPHLCVVSHLTLWHTATVRHPAVLLPLPGSHSLRPLPFLQHHQCNFIKKRA